MTIKDYINKILFAFELAFLPWIVFSYIYIPNWKVVLGVFVALVLVCHIGRELTKDKTSFTHQIMTTITNIVVFATIIIFFISISKSTIYVNKELGIATIVIISLFHLISLLTRKTLMPEMIDAIDYCNMLFEMLTLFAFIFVVSYSMIATIAMIAIILTGVVSIVYKLYYMVRYYDIWGKFTAWIAKLRTKK